ncbi:MAG TPA: 3-carboxy-cis,cis-muconate cycloisomerase [Caulobacteraceae bacterium]|nr:3-carboxy-cis,cis-muconate cycloisomerase [Caulobacteraceae bacterium]
MTSLLRDRPASTPEMLAAFGDDALLKAALAFEAALASASAVEGLIPAAAADLIAAATKRFDVDIATLADEAAHAGALAIPLVRRLREQVAAQDPAAAAFVHRGATSQDLADTALMLQARAGAALISTDALAVGDALAALAEAHAETPMLGRTLLQAAQPITLGLKAAAWMRGLEDARLRFEREATAAIRVQLGGPVGTLAGLTTRVADVMAADLGLAPALPWHAQREAVAGLGTALAILTGALGKIAQDIALMAQSEVGEAAEPRIEGRGGSSSMPGKRNPTGCQVVLSAALRAPGLASGLIAGLPQAHERDPGGWQAEAPALASLFELAHGALATLRPVVEGLEVDTAAMARNLAAAGVGADVGHAAELTRRALAARRAAL